MIPKKYATTFKQVFSELTPESRVSILYHMDGDGFCSAALLIKALESKGVNFIKSMPGRPHVMASLLEQSREQKPDFLFILDMSANELREVNDVPHVIIIDHHETSNDLTSNHVLHINTHFWTEKYYPASKLCYDVFSVVADIKDFAWIAAVGLISDAGGKDWKSFLDKVYKTYPELREGKAYGFDCPLGKTSHFLNAGRVHGAAGARVAVRALLNSASPHDILERANSAANELYFWYLDVQKRVNDNIEAFNEHADKHGDVSVFKVLNGKNLLGTIATTLADKNPHTTLIIINDEENKDVAFVSLRRNDGKRNLSEAVLKGIHGLRNAGGGGHKNAAAANVLKKDLPEFINKLVKELRQL